MTKNAPTNFKLLTFDTFVWDLHKMQAQSSITQSPFPPILAYFLPFS